MKDQTTLPADLAGYQLVVYGPVQAGDIIKEHGFAYPCGADIVHEGSKCIGMDSVRFAEDNISIYRKMPCPKQADANERMAAYQGEAVADLTDKKPKAHTYDDGKPPLAWLPWDGIKEVALVQAYGHAKYKDFNNYRKGMEVSRNLSCAMRHIGAYMEGEDFDPESKRSHLAHAACRILFVLQNLKDKTAIDDRYKR